MKKSMFGVLAAAFVAACSHSDSVKDEPVLKDAFAGKFYLGTALGKDFHAETTARHFNAITPENMMKPEEIQPREGEFDFSRPDRFVAFGEEHGMKIIGHCLVWHNQVPGWIFVDGEGNEVDRETLIARMRTHIMTVVGRYRGRIHGWDVVNEAVNDDGTMRESPWYRIIGRDFIELAFRFAHEADPEAELYYNDYSLEKKAKRDTVIGLVKELRSKGIRVDAVGTQSHVSLEHPDIGEYEESLKEFAAAGIKVAVTELDVSVLPSAWDNTAEITARHDYDEKYNPWKDGRLPDEVQEKLARRYEEFFSLFVKYSGNIDRVSVWGVTDGESWLNNFPVRGRTDYPLFFDREMRVKPCARRITEL